MKFQKLLAFALFLFGLPFVMAAHPGHGAHTHDGFSVIHYFTEPEHALVSVGILVSVAVIFYYRYQISRKKA